MGQRDAALDDSRARYRDGDFKRQAAAHVVAANLAQTASGSVAGAAGAVGSDTLTYHVASFFVKHFRTHSMILKFILLGALVRLLLLTQKPFLCSGIYAGITLLFSLIGGNVKFLPLLLTVVIVFVLSSIYFWLLHRFEDNNGIFFSIAALGFGILIFFV